MASERLVFWLRLNGPPSTPYSALWKYVQSDGKLSPRLSTQRLTVDKISIVLHLVSAFLEMN